MNSLVVAIIGIVALIIGYRFYGAIIEKLFDIDKSKETPATANYDGVDYVPAKHWTILFGHHFSSIAGAGPIIGPVLACVYWGWLPSLLWIVLGTIFIGGVHDFSSLIVSIKNGGKSIGDITQSVMGRKTKIIFSLFLFLALILVIAVFAATTAQTLIGEPKVVIPTFGLILVAVLIGFLIYVLKFNYVLSTIFGLILLAGLLFLGNSFPIVVGGGTRLWMAILLIYCFIASIIPVNILLQPRDYLSAYLLVFGLIFGYLGLIISHPKINVPVFTSWNSNIGNLWPMMFVFIACGAVSGFHTLVSSGTSSKQITSEGDAKKIGYGAMVIEGILAILALLSVSAGLFWTGANCAPNLIYPELIKSGDSIGTFATGYGEITRCLFGSAAGKFIAILILNAFVMTTLDTASRITRYIAVELFGEGLNIKLFRNKYFSTSVVIILAGLLAFGDWKKIWPIFGASNQLIAAIVLVVISLVLLSKKKPTGYTFYPAIFMLVTTIAAIVYQMMQFLSKRNYLLVTIGVVLIILAVIIVVEALTIYKKNKNVK
ncbi:MAG: carbon starvation protein CstA [Elusimicrobia bacterium RIFOXYC2_FULL_34_12]|nr:MAG: carbon starvation protein CstA [Elusimicrobia bacterium RIFOXYC2_FULL_34_12]OGS38894.1 MAG: carbon starvation protein CstA [Elusimicrobia bacterium RIFOXYD2_FULL_34_30]HAM39009.1 carbon starvation protein A [Elusimicrobiota bacterium]